MVLATRIGCDHLLYALFSASSCSASNVSTGGFASRITRSLILRRRDRAQLLAILLFKRRTTEYSPLFASRTIPSAASLAVFTFFSTLYPCSSSQTASSSRKASAFLISSSQILGSSGVVI